jgi:hypothetical protein
MLIGNSTSTRLRSTTTAARKDKHSKLRQKEIRTKMLDEAVKMYTEAMKDGNKHVRPNAFRAIIDAFGKPSWMTRHAIYYHYKKTVLNVLNIVDNNDITQDIAEVNVDCNSNNIPETIADVPETDISDLTSSSARNKGGRPRGMKDRKHEDKKLKLAQTIAATKLQEIKKTQVSKKKLVNGTVDNVIIDSLTEVGLPLEYKSLISKACIETRVRRNNVLGYKGSFSQSSPMAPMEPMLVMFCQHLNRMAKSINEKEFLALANDIIDNTPTADSVKQFHRVICGTDEEGKRLGRKYFENFMQRHKDIVHTKKLHKRCVNRLEWAIYENVEKMYSLVYKEMVAAGVATQLDEPIYFDKVNNIVGEGDEHFGTLSDVQVTDPSYILFVDETGSNTNMRKDKVGSKRVIAEKGFSGEVQAISTDLRYTTMGFTAATGEPVMCCVIFCSDSTKGIPSSWVTGIDITKIDSTFTVPDDINDAIGILGETGAGVAGGGPRCMFRNKSVPCLIQYSPHGGVTPAILTNCLKQMDQLNLFPRENGKVPFLLLDGHDSRFSLDFLRYIRSEGEGEDHKWCCCIGLPYGTHLWQVGDSPAQNGNYKHYEAEFKAFLLRQKSFRMMPLTMKPTDIIPIVNYAWSKSFAVVKNNKKAILERGWFPTNRALLVHQEVLRTKKTNNTNSTHLENTNATLTSSLSTLVYNPNNGMSGIIFDEAINNQRNHPEAMKRRKERLELATATKDGEKVARKLTSGTAYHNDMIGLHNNDVWEHQQKWHASKQSIEEEKKNARKKVFLEKKKKCDEIRKRSRNTWTIKDLGVLLTYKRSKGDPVIKQKKDNRLLMINEWDRVAFRPTPPSSPICIVESHENIGECVEQDLLDTFEI